MEAGAMNPTSIRSIDHVQMALPAGGEDLARSFYSGILGLPEVPKPESMAASGGCWFETDDFKLHFGVVPDFVAAKKAHVAFGVADVVVLAVRLRDSGVDVVDDNRLPGYRRFFASDPFGNRLEFLEALAEPG